MDDVSTQAPATLPRGHWKVPRPPAFRLCTLHMRCDDWPDKGGGIWQVNGFEGLDTEQEVFLLRQVASSRPGNAAGETIRFWRRGHEDGYLRVWRGTDIEDPAFNAEPKNRR